MTLPSSVKGRLSVRAELEQAFLRLAMVIIVFAFIALSSAGADVKIFVGGLLAVALGIVVAICVEPEPNAWRRFTGITFDVVAITFYVWHSGPAGVSMIGVYLFLCIGYGFRFGRRYLYLCQAFCVAGFSAALIGVPYWQAHLVEGWGLLCTLILVPFYVAMLLERMRTSRLEAEQALEECRERQRFAG
jgi:two-component system sensor histidine kinase RpfC